MTKIDIKRRIINILTNPNNTYNINTYIVDVNLTESVIKAKKYGDDYYTTIIEIREYANPNHDQAFIIKVEDMNTKSFKQFPLFVATDNDGAERIFLDNDFNI